MTLFYKKYVGFLVLLFLLGGVGVVKSQSVVKSPEIECVAVDSAGNVTLTWAIPTNLDTSWRSYNIYAVGFHTPIVAITTSAQTFVTIAEAALPANPNNSSVSFYITDSTSRGNTLAIDTASSINLTVNSSGGIAELYWNPIHSPLLSGSSKWYRIYREYKYVWTLIDSTQNLHYGDTIRYCSAYLHYRVEIADSTICTSSSNWAGSYTIPFTSSIPPPQAFIDTVSVNSFNSIDITWSKSQENNVIGYIIYEYQTIPQIFEPIDTVFGINSTFFNFTAGNPSAASFMFEVAQLDSCSTKGPLSSNEQSMYLTQSPNTCAQTNTLTWTSYINLSGGVAGYKVFYNVNNGPYQLLGTTIPGDTTYLDTNLNTPELRNYYVRAFDSVNSEITAASNIVHDTINALARPRNNYLRTATVLFERSEINIVGYIDSATAEGFYEFQRSTDSVGNYLSVAIIPAPLHTDSISYIDNAVNTDAHSYIYRILTLDFCYKPIDTTNIGQTMLLNAYGEPNKINVLTWNDYTNWFAGPSYYLVYRSLDGVHYSILDTVAYSGIGQHVLRDNVDSIITGSGIFYYYVVAIENDTVARYPYPFTDNSYSNLAEAYQNPVVYIPSAFDPNGVNKIFIPVGVFVGVTGYDFCIFNRWGNLIFETNDPAIGWNGKDGGSRAVQEGLYFYLITYTSSRGEYFQRKGSVTLLK